MQDKIPQDSKKVASFCETWYFGHETLNFVLNMVKSPIEWMHFKTGFSAKNVLHEF